MAEYERKRLRDPITDQPEQTSDAENYVINLDHEQVKSKVQCFNGCSKNKTCTLCKIESIVLSDHNQFAVFFCAVNLRLNIVGYLRTVPSNWLFFETAQSFVEIASIFFKPSFVH